MNDIHKITDDACKDIICNIVRSTQMGNRPNYFQVYSQVSKNLEDKFGKGNIKANVDTLAFDITNSVMRVINDNYKSFESLNNSRMGLISIARQYI